ncbi:MAG: hypothetical protein JWN66_2431 [Sphingomonas bacterium]|uniref:hypothetical protein n=1 Tax=Sphingomonas bacterium TaxID=1895847 RepID=UPI002601F7BE|nr:hypothetical protein [Sphingomonas bacterium]MDB5705315.1 hypothetical protein [Sphingomonas bacterium]
MSTFVARPEAIDSARRRAGLCALPFEHLRPDIVWSPDGNAYREGIVGMNSQSEN